MNKLLQANTGWRVWWKLTRPHTLTAGFIPVLIGSALALEYGSFKLRLFLAMLVASLLIQAATNMFNEYYDYKRGLDHAGSVGIGGAIVRDHVKPKTVMQIALLLYLISFFIGIYICMNSSWWLAVAGFLAMTIGYLYTGGPLPIAYTPFGEVTAGFFMGYLIIAISFFIQVGTVTNKVWIISIPVSILIGNILLANNIRDLEDDRKAGRKTLAILLGKQKAVLLLMFLFIISFVWMSVLAFFSYTSIWTLIALLAVSYAARAIKGFQNGTKPIEMMPAMKATAQTNTVFGFLYAIGMYIGYYFA